MAAILDIFGLTDNDALNDSTFDKQAFDLSLMGTEHYAKEKVKLVEAMHYNGPMPKPEKTGSELITEALNSLSLKEREKIDNDVNGTGLDMMSSDPDATTGMPRNDVELSSFEDPNYQREKLREMETELKRQRDGNSWKLQMVAIEMAETQNLNYVQDPRLRLRFLRCDNWNVEAAASRFIRHFDWKLELFGEEKLTKDIGLEDLQAEDVNMLKKGYMQRLPARDRAGRCVFTSIYNGQKYPSPESLSRQMYFMACGDDDETDRNGIVMLFFKIRLPQFSKDQSISSYINTYRAVTDMPVRVVATHKMLEVGTPGISRMQRLMDSAVSFIAPSARARLRLYYGSYTEWMYDLMTLGIPHNLIPFTSEYKIKTKNHLDYLAMRKCAYDYRASTNGMIQTTSLPTNFDVLLGKGKPIQESAGNLKLAAMIDDYVAQYHSSSKQEKTALAATVVHKVKLSSGKFLSKESGVWIEVSDDVARDKVSHMFRHQRQRANKACAQLTGNTSTVRPLERCAPEPMINVNAGNKRLKV